MNFHSNQDLSTRIVGLLLAVFAALFFSTRTVLVKLAYQYSVDPITLLCLRMLFSLPFFLFMVIYQANKKDAKQIDKNSYLAMFILGIIGYYLASLFDFIGLQYIPAGVGRLILFLYPTLTLLIATIFMSHQIRLKEGIALVLSYLGVAMVCLNDSQVSSENFLLGAFLVFVSALCFSIYLTGGVSYIKQIGSNRFTSIVMSVSSLAVFVHFLLFRDITSLIQPIEVYAYGFAMAVFSTVLPVFLMSAAINKLGVVKTTMVGSFAPVATIVFGMILLDETMSIIQVIGAAIILIGIYQLKNKS